MVRIVWRNWFSIKVEKLRSTRSKKNKKIKINAYGYAYIVNGLKPTKSKTTKNQQIQRVWLIFLGVKRVDWDCKVETVEKNGLLVGFAVYIMDDGHDLTALRLWTWYFVKCGVSSPCRHTSADAPGVQCFFHNVVPILVSNLQFTSIVDRIYTVALSLSHTI